MAASAVRFVVKLRDCFHLFPVYINKNIIVNSQHQNFRCGLESLQFIRSFASRPYSSESLPHKPRAKTEPKPRITLIGTDEKISVVLVEEAEKIAKRRDLKLVKVSDLDTKSQRPVYRLASHAAAVIDGTGSNKTNVKNKSATGGLKGEKQVSFSPKISQHDIESRVKQMNKWLQKNLEIRVTINGSAGDSASMVCILFTGGTIGCCYCGFNFHDVHSISLYSRQF